jgi:hypothetical protein
MELLFLRYRVKVQIGNAKRESGSGKQTGRIKISTYRKGYFELV